jgi:hypothetical protein
MSNLSSISWSTARYSSMLDHAPLNKVYARHHLAPLMAIGSDDCNTGTGAKLQLWEYAVDR